MIVVIMILPAPVSKGAIFWLIMRLMSQSLGVDDPPKRDVSQGLDDLTWTFATVTITNEERNIPSNTTEQ